MRRAWVFAAVFFSLSADPSRDRTLLAQVPLGTSFTYQGRLLVNGAAANASYDFQFTLYDSTPAAVAGPITRTSVAVTNGLFTVELDFGASPFAGRQRLLEIAVQPAGSGSYTTLAPRQVLDAVPYALASRALVLPWSVSISSSGQALLVTNTGTGTAIYGSTPSVPNPAVAGYNSGSGMGVWGYSEGGGTGVLGYSPTGYGTKGQSTSGTGVVGSSGSGSGVYGGSGSGPGVNGVSDSGVGVNAQSGAAGTGAVYAYNTGGGRGVWGYSPSGYGLEGQSGTSYGVYGYSDSSYAGYFDGSVYVSGNFVNPSDARLKASVAPLPYGLDEILRLAPVSWRPLDGRAEERYGVIAQDLQKVLPGLVVHDCDADAPLAVDYVGLVPVLVNALKEEHAELDRKSTDLAALQKRIDALEERLRDVR